MWDGDHHWYNKISMFVSSNNDNYDLLEFTIAWREVNSFKYLDSPQSKDGSWTAKVHETETLLAWIFFPQSFSRFDLSLLVLSNSMVVYLFFFIQNYIFTWNIHFYAKTPKRHIFQEMCKQILHWLVQYLSNDKLLIKAWSHYDKLLIKLDLITHKHETSGNI